MFSRIQRLGHIQKLLIAIFHDTIMTVFAVLLAFITRFDGFNIPPDSVDTLRNFFILTPIVQVPIFYMLGVYKGVWRYSSTPDLIKVIKSVLIATIALYSFAYLIFRLDVIPRSIPVLQILFLVTLMGGGRLIYRIFRDSTEYGIYASKGREKLIIIGAGAGGERLFREIRKNPSLNLHVVGFIDDSDTFRNRTIHGVPVLGTTNDISQIISQSHVQKVFIAIPSADSIVLRRIYERLKPFKIEIRTLPSMIKTMEQDFKVQNLERIKIEDLLGREEIAIESYNVSKEIKGKKILITGAGGSIGSELCEQVAKFKPKALVAIDLSELNTYQLEKKLKGLYPELKLITLIGDIRDKESITTLIKNEKPEVVFHTAAYKHVPLMEFNPYESVRTNIFGTENVAKACISAEVERFVLVSTDKAVNPTNIMGTTKRVAELIVQDLKNISGNSTKLMTVRFGNVLGSSGSVIPLFRQQIKKGGPLTVTHKDITRYFMSIPEASKLVIQAGTMGQGGEIFVLNMGSPVKIYDLAKEMINLAGLTEGLDIEVQVTGLRPGEKLYEEPLMDQEALIRTTHPKVLVSRARPVVDNFDFLISKLRELKHFSERKDYIKVLNQLVPEYKPFFTDTPLENSKTIQ